MSVKKVHSFPIWSSSKLVFVVYLQKSTCELIQFVKVFHYGNFVPREVQLPQLGHRREVFDLGDPVLLEVQQL